MNKGIGRKSRKICRLASGDFFLRFWGDAVADSREDSISRCEAWKLGISHKQIII